MRESDTVRPLAGAASNRLPFLVLLLALVLGAIGCGTTQPEYTPTEANAKPAEAQPVVLTEGNIIKISFPGAPGSDSVQQIRRDGKITLPLGAGEFTAAGKTISDLQQELLKLYAPQLVVKEVNVTLQNAQFPVFVTGAVLRPGKVLSDHPITALEAIMEAGGFDYTKANLKSIRVIRDDKGKREHFNLNLRRVLDGESSDTFYLQPSDIIYVPERFQWF